MNRVKEQWLVTAKRGDFYGLAAQFGLDPVTIRLLVNRGMKNAEDIKKYLYADWQDEYDPCLMKGAAEGAQLLYNAIRNGERIMIASDFDVDGIFSGRILLEAITACGGTAVLKAPDRVKEGYGVNPSMVEKARAEGVTFMITCDNGIAAFDAVKRAKELGMTVVVTDHHSCQFKEDADGVRHIVLPEADVIVNPHQPGCGYPFKGLCGAGVAYKLVQILYALAGKSREDSLRFLEYAGIATVADVMDLVDENRIFVREGLARLEHTENAGLAALINVCGLSGRKLTAYHIGFVLGPCFNSAGRLETVDRAFALLSASGQEAYTLASGLKELNDSRKTLTNEGVKKAAEYVDSLGEIPDVLVVPLADCHESLCGIIAGKVRERYNHPAIVLTETAEGYKGSGRSIEEYDMFEGLMKIAHLFLKFGGHPMAAGLTLKKENLPALMAGINENTGLSAEDFVPKIHIDLPMPAGYASEKIVAETELLGPFGKGNPAPLFADRSLKIVFARIMGREGTMRKFTLETAEGIRREAVWFGDGKTLDEMLSEAYGRAVVDALYARRSTDRYAGNDGSASALADIRIDITYSPQINEYMGNRTLQLQLKNVRIPSDAVKSR